ncbi:MAG: LysE family translocator [Pseudomonadota bacterium]
MIDALPAFLVFAVSTLFTPGPNNIMLTASGANFGFRRTIPHILGVDCGFAFMVFAVGMGLGAAFEAADTLQQVMRWIGAAFLIYLGLRIATAGRSETGAARGRPFRFYEAAAFQWVNPKAWAMAVGAYATFAPPDASPLTAAATFAAIFWLIGLTSSGAWAAFGVGIGRLLDTNLKLRVFNVALGALTIASVGLLFL